MIFSHLWPPFCNFTFSTYSCPTHI